MCGKKSDRSLIVFKVAGSPPHVREKEKGFDKLSEGLRITPACAGKSPFQDAGCEQI